MQLQMLLLVIIVLPAMFAASVCNPHAQTPVNMAFSQPATHTGRTPSLHFFK
jgi:hypothetical protein